MSYVTASSNLPRSIDVQISVNLPQTETRTNLSIPCVVCENLGLLPNANRVRIYTDLAGVLTDYNSDAEAYQAAAAFFAQSPNAGTIAIGEVFLSAQPALLAAPAFTATAIAEIAAIVDGSMKIGYNDGTPGVITLTGMDFTGVTDVAGIVAIINTAIGSALHIEAASKVLPGGVTILTIETVATGDNMTLTAAVTAGAGTFVGDVLGLSTTGNVDVCKGYTPTGIADEMDNVQNAGATSGLFFYGWALGASLRIAATQEAAAVWALAQEKAILGLTTNDTGALDPSIVDDIGTVIKATNNKRVFSNYHNNAQRYPEIAVLAQMLAVNYQLQDSTRTAKFMQLAGIETVPVTPTQWATLKNKGYNTYTAVGNNAQTYREGATDAATGWYLDDVINIDNFIEDLSVNVYNVFLRNKKVPYTYRGQMMLVDPAHDTGEQYVFNGSFADRQVPDSAQKSGYSTLPAVQIVPTPIYQMSAADRASRIGPPIAITVEMAGAIHSVALSVTVVE